MSNAPAVEATGGVQSVDRALSILEILARSGECGVTEIAAALAVHKSTAFRLVTTLEQHGLVEQVEGRGKYRLGVGLLRLARAPRARLAVGPQRGGASAAAQTHTWGGQHIPLHAPSNGKVLMAWLGTAELGDLLGRLPSYT